MTVGNYGSYHQFSCRPLFVVLMTSRLATLCTVQHEIAMLVIIIPVTSLDLRQ